MQNECKARPPSTESLAPHEKHQPFLIFHPNVFQGRRVMLTEKVQAAIEEVAH